MAVNFRVWKSRRCAKDYCFCYQPEKNPVSLGFFWVHWSSRVQSYHQTIDFETKSRLKTISVMGACASRWCKQYSPFLSLNSQKSCKILSVTSAISLPYTCTRNVNYMSTLGSTWKIVMALQSSCRDPPTPWATVKYHWLLEVINISVFTLRIGCDKIICIASFS